MWCYWSCLEVEKVVLLELFRGEESVVLLELFRGEESVVLLELFRGEHTHQKGVFGWFQLQLLESIIRFILSGKSF